MTDLGCTNEIRKGKTLVDGLLTDSIIRRLKTHCNGQRMRLPLIQSGQKP